MTPESVSAMEPPQPSGMGEVGRLTGVFFEPKKTFEDIAQKPSFWTPLILLTLASVVFVFLMSSHIGWSTIIQQGVQNNPSAQQRMEQMSPEQRQQAEAMQQKIGPIMGYSGALLGGLIMSLVVAAVMMGIFRGMMSAPVRFKQVFSIVWWASLPNLIQTILMGVVMFLKKPEDFNLMNPLAFNPAAFMDPTTSSKFVYAVAKSFDVFTIWVILLMALGLKVAGGKKISMGAAVAGVVAPWLLWVLARGALSGVFG